MLDEDVYRYAFLVRQDFMEDPEVDSFHRLRVPNLSSSQLEMMQTLDPDWMKDELDEDYHAIKGMSIRATVDGSVFTEVCMVNVNYKDLTREELDSIIKSKYKDGTLKEFLKSAKI